MAVVDQILREERHDELDAAVSARWDREPGWGNLGDAHTEWSRRSAGSARIGAMPQPWTSSASASLDGGIVTLVEGSSFAISLPSGDMLPGHPHGLFFRDTRFLSELRLRVNDEWPEPLAAQTLDPFSAAFVLRAAPQSGRADSHLVVFRNRFVGRGMREDVTVHNYGEEPAYCAIEVHYDCDFADLFEVKESRVEKAGDLSVDCTSSTATFTYSRGASGAAPTSTSRSHRRSRTGSRPSTRSFPRGRVGRCASSSHRSSTSNRSSHATRAARRSSTRRPTSGSRRGGRSCRVSAPTTTRSSTCSPAPARTSPPCGSSIPSSPTGRSSRPARPGS